MKILAIIGSPRNGNTYKIIQQIEANTKKITNIDFDYLYLEHINLGYNAITAGPGQYLSGRLAFAAIWERALTAEEITALAVPGTLPSAYSTNLVAYWPLNSDLVDDAGAFDLSTSASAPTNDTADGPW